MQACFEPTQEAGRALAMRGIERELGHRLAAVADSGLLPLAESPIRIA